MFVDCSKATAEEVVDLMRRDSLMRRKCISGEPILKFG